MSKIFLRKYGEAATIDFDLFEVTGVDFRTDAVHASGDTVIMKNEAAEASTTNGFTDEGSTYSIVLTATEMQAARIKIIIIDQTATKVWLDTTITIETYGHASAQHAFDLDTAVPGVDVIQVSGDSTAADNLELMFDGTGYTDDTAPSSRSQVDGIGAASGGSFGIQNEGDNVDSAIKGVTFVGVETSGTNESVDFNDGVYHQIDDTAGGIDIVYQYDVGGGRTAVEVIWKGRLSGVPNSIALQTYNGSTWDTIATIDGKAGSTNDVETHSVFLQHTGTGADLGKVYVRLVCVGQTNPTLYTDQLFVSAVNIGQTIGYAGGAIWVDTNASNTNTEAFVDGVADNPVSTWAAALTLSAALNIKRFKIAPGSAITLTANSDDYEIAGQAYTLALGGQSIDGLYVFGGAISGTGTNTSVAPVFEDCPVGNVTLPPSVLRRCFLSGTITSSGAGDWYINHCMSRVAGTGSPVFDFGAAVGNTNLNMRLWSGGIQLESMGDTGTDAASIEGNGQVIEGACTGGVVAVRGNFTTAGITNLTLSDDARFSIEDLVDFIWDELLTSGTHNINKSAGKYLRGVEEFQGYEGGFIYIDTVNGAAGSESYVNGVLDNPVNNITDANILAAALGLEHFHIASGSSITFIASQTDQTFEGEGWTLALGGQDISNTDIHSASVSGIGTGASRAIFRECCMDSATISLATLMNCALDGDLVLGSAGTYIFNSCYSAIAGTATPSVDVGAAVGNTSVNFRHYSGGIELKNLGQAGTDNASVEGDGQVILNANCIGGTIAIRGNFTLTDNSSTTTVSDNARIDIGQINAQMADVMKTDVIAEMSVGAPPKNPTFEEAVMYVFMALTHKIDITAAFKEFHNDAGTLVWKKGLTDDGTTYSEAEGESG
ncbi:MAG: hypothetical protein KAR40_09650 [Candidatus Sabulitectum sp.]|nr:hypothetical protein [Candidatus Sabulitectum sp.]